jgi:DNA-binding transcriptional regulator YhcF (GntR family)
MQQMQQWRLNFDSSTPIYSQIIANFSRAIVRAELQEGERVPSIRDLAAQLKVNTNTVARAYHDMERDGLIYSQRGTGYFIMENKELTKVIKKEMVAKAIDAFLSEMRALGLTNEEILDLVRKGVEKK